MRIATLCCHFFLKEPTRRHTVKSAPISSQKEKKEKEDVTHAGPTALGEDTRIKNQIMMPGVRRLWEEAEKLEECSCLVEKKNKNQRPWRVDTRHVKRAETAAVPSQLQNKRRARVAAITFSRLLVETKADLRKN